MSSSNYIVMTLGPGGITRSTLTDSPQLPEGWETGPGEMSFVVEAHDLVARHGHEILSAPPACTLRHSTPMDPGPPGASYAKCACGSVGFYMQGSWRHEDFRYLG